MSIEELEERIGQHDIELDRLSESVTSIRESIPGDVSIEISQLKDFIRGLESRIEDLERNP